MGYALSAGLKSSKRVVHRVHPDRAKTKMSIVIQTLRFNRVPAALPLEGCTRLAGDFERIEGRLGHTLSRSGDNLVFYVLSDPLRFLADFHRPRRFDRRSGDGRHGRHFPGAVRGGGIAPAGCDIASGRRSGLGSTGRSGLGGPDRHNAFEDRTLFLRRGGEVGLCSGICGRYRCCSGEWNRQVREILQTTTARRSAARVKIEAVADDNGREC